MADPRKGSRVTGAERDQQAADLKKRYNGGESIRSLAESTGRSYGFIHRILSESGTAMRDRGGRRAQGGTKSRAKAVSG